VKRSSGETLIEFITLGDVMGGKGGSEGSDGGTKSVPREIPQTLLGTDLVAPKGNAENHSLDWDLGLYPHIPLPKGISTPFRTPRRGPHPKFNPFIGLHPNYK
jgi:hypothetical protein